MKKTITIGFLLISFFAKAQWMDVGGGVYNTQSQYCVIACMAVYDDNLWIYGGFDVAGADTGLQLIATWDGQQWDGVFPGNDDWDNIYCFGRYIDSCLYIGGGFEPTINFTVGYGIGRWNGTAWESFTYGTANGFGTIWDLCAYHDKLYAAGQIWEMCDSVNNCISVDDIAAWDGSHWGNVAGGPGSNEIKSLIVYNDELIAGGEIHKHLKYNTVARWNDTSWRAIGRFGLIGSGGGGTVYDMVVDTLRNLLYVSSSARWADGELGYCILQWDGRRWKFIRHDVFQGLQPRLAMYHNDLYMSGVYNTPLPNGDTVSGVMKWNGAEWSGVGGKLYCHNFTYPALGYMRVFHDTLYLGGNIDHLITPAGDTVELNEIACMYAPPDTTCKNLLENYNRIWAKDTTFCDVPTVSFDNNTYYYADSWWWDFGDGNADTLPDPIHTYDTVGTYDVTLVTTYKNCVDTTEKTISIFPCDSLQVELLGPPDTVYMILHPGNIWAAAVTYEAIADCDMGQFYYYWDMGNGWQDSGYIETANWYWPNPYDTYYDSAGTYVITLVIQLDCCYDTVYDTLVVIDPNVGIDEFPGDKAYLGQNIPNPFSNTTTIPYYVPQGTKGSIFITDINGRLVERYNLIEGRNQLELSMSRYADGIYFYSLKIDGQVKDTKKMVLEK